MLATCAFGALAIALPLAWPSQLDVAINPFLLGVIGAVGLNLLMGTAGQISLGQAAFLAVGSYTAVAAEADFHLSFILAFGLAIPTGITVGLLVGLSAARVKGLYAVLGTLALHYIVIFAVSQYQYYGNATAAFVLPEAKIGPWDVASSKAWYVVLIACASLAVLGYHRLLRSHTGRALVAIRDRGSSAATFGIPVIKYRLLAWALSGAIVSGAGALTAYYQGVVSSDSFTLTLAIVSIAAIVVGGMGSPLGTVLGVAVLTLVPLEATAVLSSVSPVFASSPSVPLYEEMFDGAILVAFLWIAPGGMVGLLRSGGQLNRFRPTSRGRPARRESQIPALPEAIDASATRALLRANDITAGYGGGGIALDQVSLEVGRGEVVAILGPNGAGKTTLLRALAGFTRGEGGSLRRGSIQVDGREVAPMSAYRRARAGVVMVPDREKVFAELTVEENLTVATRGSRWSQSSVLELFPQIADKLGRPGVLLSGGERQMLAMASALLLDPTVLLIDEATLGLSPRMARSLLLHLRDLAESQAIGILIVEQNVRLAFSVADRYYVLNRGRVVARGSTTTTDPDDVLAAYVGWHVSDE